MKVFDLIAPAGNHISNDAIQPEGGEEDGQQGEAAGENRHQALAEEGFLEAGGEGAEFHPHGGIDGGNGILELLHQGIR